MCQNVVAHVFIRRLHTSKAQDSGPFQYRPGLCRLGQGRVEEVDALILVLAPYPQDLGFADMQSPLVRYNSAGVAYWVSQRSRYLAGCGAALSPCPGAAGKTHGVWASTPPSRRSKRSSDRSEEHPLFAKGKQEERSVDAPTHRGRPARWCRHTLLESSGWTSIASVCPTTPSPHSRRGTKWPSTSCRRLCQSITTGV